MDAVTTNRSTNKPAATWLLRLGCKYFVCVKVSRAIFMCNTYCSVYVGIVKAAQLL